MQDAPKTEAQAAAEALIAQYGEPRSRDSLVALLATAYAHGAVVAAAEAARTMAA